MKIKSIELMRLDMPRQEPKTPPRRPCWAVDAEVANPMSKFPEYKRHRNLWMPHWETVWVKVTAEDGTYGLSPCSYGLRMAPTASAPAPTVRRWLPSLPAISPNMWWGRT